MEAFWARIMQLDQTLDRMSYYHLLGVEPGSSPQDVKAAYYRRIRGVHPDRHTYERDPARKRALVRLNARFGEAFRVLQSPDLRSLYDDELAAGRVRLTPDAQRRKEAELSGPDPRTPQGISLLREGQMMLQQGNPRGAVAKLKMAAQFERDSRAIKAALEQAEKAAAG